MRVLILGAKGTLGAELARQLQKYSPVCLDRVDFDFTDFKLLRHKIIQANPEVIFNCAAYNAVDMAEEHQDTAKLLNSELPTVLAKISEELDATLVHYSSGFVFDGQKGSYLESELPNPQSVYASTKYWGELAVQNYCKKYYLIRLNLLFGQAGGSELSKKSFPDLILEQAKRTESFDFIDDEISTPTYAVDLASASIALILEKYAYGIYHLVNEGQASWYDFAKEVFTINGLRVKINAIKAAQLPRPAKRPSNSVLLNTKFPKLRPWQAAIKEYLETK